MRLETFLKNKVIKHLAVEKPKINVAKTSGLQHIQTQCCKTKCFSRIIWGNVAKRMVLTTCSSLFVFLHVKCGEDDEDDENRNPDKYPDEYTDEHN